MYRYLFFLLLWISCLESFVSRFQRLVKIENGNIVKVVDLLSDWHEEKIELAPIAGKQKPYLTMQERQQLSQADRSLIVAWRKMAETKGELISLLWEISEEHHEKLAGLTDQQYKKFKAMNRPGLIAIGGKMFKEEFAPNNNKRLQFIASDSLRYGSSKKNRLALNRYITKGPFFEFYQAYYNNPLSQAIAQVRSLLQDNSMLEKKMQQVKNVSGIQTYEILHKLWIQYRDKTLKPYFDKWYKDVLNEQPDIMIKQFVDAKKLEKSFVHPARIIEAKITDFEILINIFSLPQKHIIGYFGAEHIRHVVKLLQESFRLILVIDMGSAKGKYLRFDPQMWNFLTEDPSLSYSRFRKKGVLKRVVEKTDIATMDEFARQIVDGQPVDLKKLEAVIKKSLAAGVRLFEIKTLPYDKTLLTLAIERNKKDVIQLLLKHGVRLNMPEDFRNQPLYVALFEVKKPNLEIIEMLLERGANPNSRDPEGNTLFFYAVLKALSKKKWFNIVELLLQYKADPNVRNNQGVTPWLEVRGHYKLDQLLNKYR